MATGLFDSDVFLQHDSGAGHPERPARLAAIRQGLERSGLLSRLVRVEPQPATLAELGAVHDAGYVDALRRFCKQGGGHLDADTHVGTKSWGAALAAAGAAIGAAVDVLEGRLSRAFCAVRPPGHHARPHQAMGFCLFDNVAVATQAVIADGLAKRVAIIDWDVHHGNGTQEIFWERGDVLYASLHAYPFYPGSGAEDEVGIGAGAGATVNCPLAAGSSDTEWLAAFDARIRPAIDSFGPELIVASAGFDADGRDPLGSLTVSTRGFEAISTRTRALADEHCGGRLVSVLEGGYDLEALAEDAAVHVATLL